MVEPLEFLEERSFEIKFQWINKQSYAQIDIEKEIITINQALLLARAFIHEYYHSQGLWDEEKIRKMTDRKLERMKVKEIKKLADLLLTHYFTK